MMSDNPLKFWYGVESQSEWNHYVFKLPILAMDNEPEEEWSNRLLHTSDAIEQRLVEIESMESWNRQQKKTSRHQLIARLKEIEETIGFIPTTESAFNEFDTTIDDICQTVPKTHQTQSAKPLKPTQKRTPNALTQTIEELLKTKKIDTADSLWKYLKKNKGHEICELIFIHSDTGNDQNSIIEWSHGEFGTIKTINRASLAKKISLIKKQLKSKI